MITPPADRAASIRAEAERLCEEILERLEVRIAEAIAEHESDVRREYSADQ